MQRGDNHADKQSDPPDLGISTVTFVDNRSLVNSSYFDLRLDHLNALTDKLHAEARAYKELIAKIHTLAKKNSLNVEEQNFLISAKHILNQWHELVHAEITSTTNILKDYLHAILQKQLEQLQGDKDTKNSIEQRIQTTLENLFNNTILIFLQNADDIDKIDLSEYPELDINNPPRLRREYSRLKTNIDFGRSETKKRYEKFTNDRASDIEKITENKNTENFEGYVRVGDKSGGANSAGGCGGLYKNISTGKISLFKKEEVIEKVIGEYIAGRALNVIYHALRVPEARYAKVDFKRPKNAGKNNKSGNVYLRSEFIENYKADLWKFAWDTSKRKDIPKERVPGIIDRETLQWTDSHIINKKLCREFALLAAPRILLGDFGLHNGNFGVIVEEDKDKSNHLAALDYGAAFDNLRAPLQPYTQRKLYKNHFLDYGDDINATFEMANTFIQLGRIDPSIIDHAIDNGLDEVCNYYDAEALRKFALRLGIPNNDFFATTHNNAISRAFFYCVFGLKNFAEFLGIPNSLLYSTPGAETTKRKISHFIKIQIRLRQKSLENQGYGLALERCVAMEDDSAIVNKNMLKKLIDEHKSELKNELIDFIDGEAFKNYHLVFHKALIAPVQFILDHSVIPDSISPLSVIRKISDDPIKKAIIEAAKEILLPPIISPSSSESEEDSSAIYRKKISFLRRNLGYIISFTLTWTVAAAGAGIAIGLFTTGGVASALLGVVFGMWGLIVGFTIGCIACAICEWKASQSSTPGPPTLGSTARTNIATSSHPTHVTRKEPEKIDLVNAKKRKNDSADGTKIHGLHPAPRHAEVPENMDSPTASLKQSTKDS